MPAALKKLARTCQEGPLGAQNKVLAIMDYPNLRKQAYRGTGSQRGSSGGG